MRILSMIDLFIMYSSRLASAIEMINLSVAHRHALNREDYERDSENRSHTKSWIRLIQILFTTTLNNNNNNESHDENYWMITTLIITIASIILANDQFTARLNVNVYCAKLYMVLCTYIVCCRIQLFLSSTMVHIFSTIRWLLPYFFFLALCKRQRIAQIYMQYGRHR